jgi:hypothetical protein
MSITITLPPRTEEALRRRAQQSGIAPDDLARLLIEQGLNGGKDSSAPVVPAAALDEVLTPFRREVEESGVTDDELRDFFTEVRDEVRAEKRAGRSPGSAAR